MTSRAWHHRSRKGRANARPLQDSETIASTDDEILESLIDTFPASDPPAWVALARVAAGSKTIISLIDPVLYAHLQIVPPQ
jgi:hypothetical protein